MWVGAVAVVARLRAQGGVQGLGRSEGPLHPPPLKRCLRPRRLVASMGRERLGLVIGGSGLWSLGRECSAKEVWNRGKWKTSGWKCWVHGISMMRVRVEERIDGKQGNHMLRACRAVAAQKKVVEGAFREGSAKVRRRLRRRFWKLPSTAFLLLFSLRRCAAAAAAARRPPHNSNRPRAGRQVRPCAWQGAGQGEGCKGRVVERGSSRSLCVPAGAVLWRCCLWLCAVVIVAVRALAAAAGCGVGARRVGRLAFTLADELPGLSASATRAHSTLHV